MGPGPFPGVDNLGARFGFFEQDRVNQVVIDYYIGPAQ
jgi:hypothetical protein